MGKNLRDLTRVADSRLYADQNVVFKTKKAEEEEEAEPNGDIFHRKGTTTPRAVCGNRRQIMPKKKKLRGKKRSDSLYTENAGMSGVTREEKEVPSTGWGTEPITRSC